MFPKKDKFLSWFAAVLITLIILILVTLPSLAAGSPLLASLLRLGAPRLESVLRDTADDFSDHFDISPRATPDPSQPPSGGGTTPLSTSSDSPASPPNAGDGRLGSTGTSGAIYATADGIFVYGIDANSHGFLTVYVTADELANLTCPPTENRLLAESADGKFAIYQLTTCEYQVNIGPDADGKVLVTIFTDIPPANVHTSEFFVK